MAQNVIQEFLFRLPLPGCLLIFCIGVCKESRKSVGNPYAFHYRRMCRRHLKCMKELDDNLLACILR